MAKAKTPNPVTDVSVSALMLARAARLRDADAVTLLMRVQAVAHQLDRNGQAVLAAALGGVAHELTTTPREEG